MTSMYLYLKVIHLIAAFAWMAGLFYLPRLYVYHVEAGANTPQAETFKVMEQRLLRIIMNPAMIVTVAVGFWLEAAQYSWAGCRASSPPVVAVAEAET